VRGSSSIAEEVRSFRGFGRGTAEGAVRVGLASDRFIDVATFTNEFWTSAQRAAHSLHEISYRACFKPQLPRFFIERLTQPGDTVYDPFMGRGTTLLEAALLGRRPIGNDISPLSSILLKPRFSPPTVEQVRKRLDAIPLTSAIGTPEDLLVFYHPDTLRAICALRQHLLERQANGQLDAVDEWIRMVAVNRLTGHSAGFFSVYTLPPNQAVSVESQRKINVRRKQSPPRRDVPAIILRKTRSLLRDLVSRRNVETSKRRNVKREGRMRRATLLCRPADDTPEIADGSVDLVVTSPPFLDVVDYAGDNWLRCWFCGVDAASVPITIARKLEDWRAVMGSVFRELARLLRPGGHIAFEVGEVRKGQIKLEEAVIPCGVQAGLEPLFVMINDQHFTKTAHCWGVENRSKGTNTNRVVVMRKFKVQSAKSKVQRQRPL
jgi:hypothetical protein